MSIKISLYGESGEFKSVLVGGSWPLRVDGEIIFVEENDIEALINHGCVYAVTETSDFKVHGWRLTSSHQ